MTLSPGCPGPTRPDCPDRAYTGVVVVRNGVGTEVARTSTDKDGAFDVAIAPGQYLVATLAEGQLGNVTQAAVAVTAGQTSNVQLRVDSGLR